MKSAAAARETNVGIILRRLLVVDRRLSLGEGSRGQERVDVEYFTDRAMMVGTSMTGMGKYGTRTRKRVVRWVFVGG